MAINLTSILGGPVFNTKTHMYNMQPPMYERIKVLNTDGNLQLPNSWDESYISVEPYRYDRYKGEYSVRQLT